MIKGLYEAHLPVKNLERSIAFYKQLELELAYRSDRLAFFWMEKGRSWLGLWEAKESELPYHPSIRHVAFEVEREDIEKAREWLKGKGIEVRTAFGFSPERQPLVLNNDPHAHAAIYFNDPDGNSLEFITPLRLDTEEAFNMMSLAEWKEEKE